MNTNSIAKACLAAGVVSTWGAAEALTVAGVVNNGSTQGPMHFMYNSGGSGGFDGDIMIRDSSGVSFFPGNGLEKPFHSEIDYSPTIWGTLGCISPERASVGVHPDVAPTLYRLAWEVVFPGWSESELVTAILASDYGFMGAFCGSFVSYFSTPFEPGAVASLVDFSDGTPGGYVKLVPEPTSMAALGLGAAAMLRRRRKN